MNAMIFEDYLLQVESLTYEEFSQLSQMERRELEKSYNSYLKESKEAVADGGK